MNWVVALMIKPFALIVLFVLIVWPIERWIAKRIPEGRLKRILLFSWRV